MTQSRATAKPAPPPRPSSEGPNPTRPGQSAALTVDLSSGAKVRICRECFGVLKVANAKVCPGECARRRRNKLQNLRRKRGRS